LGSSAHRRDPWTRLPDRPGGNCVDRGDVRPHEPSGRHHVYVARSARPGGGGVSVTTSTTTTRSLPAKERTERSTTERRRRRLIFAAVPVVFFVLFAAFGPLAIGYDSVLVSL